MPLILLAIPSAIIGWFTHGPVLFGDYFGDAISRHAARRARRHWASFARQPGACDALRVSTGVLACRGRCLDGLVPVPEAPGYSGKHSDRLSGLYNLLDRKYYFDDLWIKGFAAGGRSIGTFLWKKGDELIIDGVMVNGTANRSASWPASCGRCRPAICTPTRSQ